MLLHRWLDEYAGGGPQYFPGPGAASSGMVSWRRLPYPPCIPAALWHCRS